MAQKKETDIPVDIAGEEELHEDGAEVVEEESTELSLSEEELTTLCREHLCPNCDVMQKAEEQRLRTLADTENVKKRLTREAEDMKRYAAESILGDLLPALDNLDLALAHADNTDESCKNFIMGVDMTRKLLLDTLKKHGLERVDAERGTVFNPEFHEAMGMACEDDLDDNTVSQAVQAGYQLKGRLLRPAKVLVNKKS